MKKATFIIFFTFAALLVSFSFDTGYLPYYLQQMQQFKAGQEYFLLQINQGSLNSSKEINNLKKDIQARRIALKKIDFWLRYLEPIVQKHINGPLPVEWETEVFEKFEKPYRRTGGGLSLAEQYLDEPSKTVDSLQQLIRLSVNAMDTYLADSTIIFLKKPGHIYFANRLFLLNLAAIYTTGFDCPDTSRVIPELKQMLPAIKEIYLSYNASNRSSPFKDDYIRNFDQLVSFTEKQPDQFSSFDRYTFIRDFVNPLFTLNQAMISEYKIYSANYNDFSLNDKASSIFDKSLYKAQTSKGVFSFVEDPATLNEIRRIGKLLFNDPILSGNNKRSCASCHNPATYFNDTSASTALTFEGNSNLTRNAPSLVNAEFNHLIMLDGHELTLQSQARSVIINPVEMHGVVTEVIEKVMSCREYADAFKRLLPLTPEENVVGVDHIIAALTFYYSSFNKYTATFDDAMNRKLDADSHVRNGFNIFMSKAQCGTCHFTPMFNGVKPPYTGSEFEVLGVPDDTSFNKISPDSGRYLVNPAPETMRAFRTGSIRNSSFTAPYMHNGVFKTLDQVIDFYDKGGGAGRKLTVENQTLESAPLQLTANEKTDLLLFLKSLDENIIFDLPPKSLPISSNKSYNKRKVGGEY